MCWAVTCGRWAEKTGCPCTGQTVTVCMEDLLRVWQHVAAQVTSAEVCSTAYLAPLHAAGAAQTASVVGRGIRLANSLRIRSLFQQLSKATTSDVWTTPKTRGRFAANH